MNGNKKIHSPLPLDTLKTLAKNAVSKLGHDFSKEDKIAYARLLLKVFAEGKSPKEILNISDEDICRFYSFANSLFSSGIYDQAYAIFKMLHMFDPTQADYTIAMGVCAHRVKAYREAMELYMQAAYLDLLNPLPVFYAYDCFYQCGDLPFAGMMLCDTIARADEPKYAKLKQKAELLLEQLKTEMSAISAVAT